MQKWQLVYFEGCPNAEKLKLDLIQIGLREFEEVEQQALESSNPLRNVSAH